MIIKKYFQIVYIKKCIHTNAVYINNNHFYSALIKEISILEALIHDLTRDVKAVGFAPLVCLFVGYLIVPLVFIGMTSMSSSMSNIG